MLYAQLLLLLLLFTEQNNLSAMHTAVTDKLADSILVNLLHPITLVVTYTVVSDATDIIKWSERFN